MPAPGAIEAEALTKFAERLQLAMQHAKKTQSELAEELGVSRQRVHKLVTGVGDPHLSTLITLSKALGVSVGWLAGEE